jgi:hypothetical protein
VKNIREIREIRGKKKVCGIKSRFLNILIYMFFEKNIMFSEKKNIFVEIIEKN